MSQDGDGNSAQAGPVAGSSGQQGSAVTRRTVQASHQRGLPASRRASPGGLPLTPVPVQGEQSEDGVSDEEDGLQQPEPARESSTAAVGRNPGQPSKSSDNFFFTNALQGLLGGIATTAGGMVTPSQSGVGQATDQQLASTAPASSGSGGKLQELLEGLRVLVGRFGEGPGQAPQGDAQRGTGGAAVTEVPATTTPEKVADKETAGEKGAAETKGRTDVVRLADAAKCEIYVCFEGPLGTHLKPEVREKIYKR